MRATVLAMVLSALAWPAPADASVEDFEDLPLVTGLVRPTAVAWAPDGRIFIAQKDGRVRVASPAGVLRPAPLIDISGHVNSFYDRGLLGLAVSTDFARTGHLYLLYTDDDEAPGGATGRSGRA